MRLHQLSITAFGPFAGQVEIDFDELSAGGLFLLTGQTGAGKTSVLDAVCFALYGQVPGDRAGAKHLRSDHAVAQVAPEVVLRVSIGEREFRFTRSPSWQRPKLRGSGETRVQAHVVIEEHRHGSWDVLTNRLDDAGLLVTDLLGMTCAQFTQVALLPQGRFQAFLRATSAERHAVLQQLFRTDRFERVERWLVERRTAVRRAGEAAADGVREVLNRIEEAAGVTEAPPWRDSLDAVVESTELTQWVRGLVRDAQESSVRAVETESAAVTAATEAGTVLTAAENLVRLRESARSARAELRALDESAAEHDRLAAALSAHRRAGVVIAPLRRVESAQRTADEAARLWDARAAALVASIAAVPTDLDADVLAGLQRNAHAAHARVEAFGPRRVEGDRARARSTELAARLRDLDAGIAELERRLAEQPEQIAEAAAAAEEARAAGRLLPAAIEHAEAVEELVIAARRRDALAQEIAEAEAERLTAAGVALEARELYLNVREARINGMAAELAGALASGCSCPVCGSADHPHPASAGRSPVGRAEEDAARRAQEDAAFDLQSREFRVAALTAEASALDDRLVGVDRGCLRPAHDAALAEVDRIRVLAEAAEVLADRELTLRAAAQQAERERAAAVAERAEVVARQAETAALVTAIEAEWRVLAGDDPALTLETLLERRDQECRSLDEACRAFAAAAESARVAESAGTELAAALAESGLASVSAVREARLADGEEDRIGALLRSAAVRRERAEQTLADPEVAAAADQPVPDLAGQRALVQRAEQAARAAAGVAAAARHRAARLTELADLFELRCAAWDPLRAEHRTVAGLAALVEGKSVDNPLRMRLAAYVLAERLRQVVAAANERLAAMTDQRYSLEHSDDRGVGEQRGGLSLRVRDDWNGVHRDPATLSGGETFVVSLALALGLADTVAHEAGGTDIDTLFIDEGFGSLDSETLEDVMDTLDTLRDGGRVVGLVSHVPELRSRITTQLEVSKGRSGSTVRAVLAGS